MAHEKAKKIADATGNAAGATLRGALKTVFTVLLILILTGLLFVCIFAYYVKTTLVDDLDINMSDFTVKLSSTIWYQDKDAIGTDEE